MANCRGCGKKITWAKNRNGVNVPMEGPYIAYTLGGPAEAPQIQSEPLEPRIYINHFQTCPKAGEFHKQKQEPKKP